MRKTLAKVFPFVAALFVVALSVLELSAVALALAKAFAGALLFYVLVKYGHDELDHIGIAERYPVYGALLLLGYAVIIAAALAGS